jgi:chromate transporter
MTEQRATKLVGEYESVSQSNEEMIEQGTIKLVGDYGSVSPSNELEQPTTLIPSRRLGMRDACWDAGLLGLYSFGGSGATVAIIRQFLVDKGYLSNAEFTEVFALAHCLPGPTGAQILLNGVTKGTGSVSAGLIAMGGFILPVAFIMGWLGCVVRTTSGVDGDSGLLASPLVALVQEFVGLAAISIIAVSAMALIKSLVATDRLLQTIFCCACTTTVAFSGRAWVTPLCIALGGATTLAHARFAKRRERIRQRIASEELGECVVEEDEAPSMDTWSALSLVLLPWVALALCLYVEHEFAEGDGDEPGGLRMFSVFFRIGIMNYGGSSVMVAVLLSQLVPYGLMTEQQFLLGFGAVQLLPGPEFNIAAYCGGVIGGPLFACVSSIAMVRDWIQCF